MIYIYFEIFYGGQKLHKYFHSLLTKDTSLLTCQYIGELHNNSRSCQLRIDYFIEDE